MFFHVGDRDFLDWAHEFEIQNRGAAAILQKIPEERAYGAMIITAEFVSDTQVNTCQVRRRWGFQREPEVSHPWRVDLNGKFSGIGTVIQEDGGYSWAA